MSENAIESYTSQGLEHPTRKFTINGWSFCFIGLAETYPSTKRASHRRHEMQRLVDHGMNIGGHPNDILASLVKSVICNKLSQCLS